MNTKVNRTEHLQRAWGVLVHQSNRHYLFEDTNVIGRQKYAFLCVNSPLFSRCHCKIGRDGDSYTITDLSSSGTYVNDKRLIKNEIHELHHHDKISLANQPDYSYVFLENKQYSHFSKQSQMLDSRLKEDVINLDNSFCNEIKKLNREMHKMEKEKADLEENFNTRLEAQANIFEQDRRNLCSLLSDKKKEEEQNLRDLEDKRKSDVLKLKNEMESKMAEIANRAVELQDLKDSMKLRYQKDKEELEERYRKEVEEMKLKLAESDFKLEESKKVLLESEAEQNRLFEEKMEVETKLGSKMVDLAKAMEENACKDELNKNLEKRLKEVETGIEGLEEELQCSICAELFIEPTVLNCGHMFCKLCIDEWKKKKKNCPVCRTKISTVTRNISLDSIIAKSARLMTAEARENREATMKQRQQSHLPAKKRRSSQPMVFVRNRLPISNRQINANRQPNADLDPIIPPPQLNDEFAWNIRRPERLAVENMRDDLRIVFSMDPPWMRPLENPVTVAAIDLTNVPVVPPPAPRTRASHTATATATSTSHDETIDLTTS